jgi:LCP family protein required for cell wall assembly
MEENSTPIAASEDVYNILLIGSDTRESGDLGRSDAMILISVNEADKTITASSFLRDIYLLIPGAGYNRINTAYAIGGADLLMDTIEENFKIQVDRYVAIDFLAFIDVIDAIGGITIEVTEEEIPVINEYIRELNEIRGEETEADYLTKPGTLLLNGKQALGFARNRYTGNADFERTARQRKVLEQIFIKIESLGILDLSSLMNTLLPKITTNLTEGELFYQILALPRYTGYELRQWSIPTENTFSYLSIRGMSVIGIDFNQNIAELHSRIYSNNNKKNYIKENKKK